MNGKPLAKIIVVVILPAHGLRSWLPSVVSPLVECPKRGYTRCITTYVEQARLPKLWVRHCFSINVQLERTQSFSQLVLEMVNGDEPLPCSHTV